MVKYMFNSTFIFSSISCPPFYGSSSSYFADCIFEYYISPKKPVQFGSLVPQAPQILLSLVGVYIPGLFRLIVSVLLLRKKKHKSRLNSSQSAQGFPCYGNWIRSLKITHLSVVRRACLLFSFLSKLPQKLLRPSEEISLGQQPRELLGREKSNGYDWVLLLFYG